MGWLDLATILASWEEFRTKFFVTVVKTAN